MAEISKMAVGVPSLSSLTPTPENRVKAIVGSVAIAAGDLCRIDSNGLIVLSDGSAATVAANVDGVASQSADPGDVLTLFRNVRFQYGDALTKGASLFLSGTVLGGLADAASTGGTAPVAFVLPDGKRIQLINHHPRR